MTSRVCVFGCCGWVGGCVGAVAVRAKDVCVCVSVCACVFSFAACLLWVFVWG